MGRSANRPWWHALVRRLGPGLLAALLVVYAFSPHLGFMAKDAGGAMVIVRTGAVGVAWLHPDQTIQDIPRSAKVGFYQPTIPMTWSVLYFNDIHGTRLYIPLWIPCVLVALAMAWVRWVERPRVQGVCPKCGYDLIGCVFTNCACCGISSTGCPECGAKVPRVLVTGGVGLDAKATSPSARTPRPPTPAPDRSPGPG